MVILMAGCFRWVKRRNQPTRDVKLVIIGLDDAGKTTTIACLQGEPPDGITPTVGFSNANITIGKWNITIYDLGGGSSVRSVWQKYYAEVYGMIFAVDSGDHNRLVESKNVLNEIFDDPKVNGKPVVVFANKQDKVGALNEEEVSEKLALQELSKQYNFKFNVFSCSALQGYGKTMDKRIKSGLEWLLNAINQDYSTINEKVTKESAIQREQELKEKKERMERIKKLREEREKAAKDAGVVEEESDEDVIVNPFRNITEQVEVTQKREKKAKEKMKKIKAYEMQKNDDVQSAGGSSKTMKSKKKMEDHIDGDGGDDDDDDGDDNDDDDDDENDDDQDDDNNLQKKKFGKKSMKKRKPFEDMPLSDDEDPSPKKKNKKKKSEKCKRKSDDENVENGELSPKKKKKNKTLKDKSQFEDENMEDSENTSPKKTVKKSKGQLNKNKLEDRSVELSDFDETCPKRKGKKNEARNIGKTKDIESELTNEYEKLNVNNKITSDLNYINGSVDLSRHNIIHVSSKESIRENSPSINTKKKKKIKKNNELDLESVASENDMEEDEHLGDGIAKKNIKKKKKMADRDVNDYFVEESSSDFKTIIEKEISDSRAELFLARSNESLDRGEHKSNCCNNKLKKGKKKKKRDNTEATEFHDVHDTKADKKKKKKKKANKTEPQLACSSSNNDVYSKNSLDGSLGNGSLPPLWRASKLEPIKLKGRLPKWNSTEDSSIPSWALAKPNFDDDDIMT